MPVRPSDLPSWATDANYANGPDLGTPTKVAPSAPFQAEGWVPGNKLPAQILNWWKNLVYEWVVWFDSLKLEQGYRYKGTVVFTSSGTYNRPADVKAVRVTVVGGGGGGGYAAPCAAGQLSCGSGGGGGATAIKLIDIAGGLGASETVTVGSGGAGGDASGSSAANGGQSSFGAHVSAGGGASGLDHTAPVASGAFSGLSGGAGGSLTSGADITLRGGRGGAGVITTAGTHTHTNRGGDSAYGRGGAAPASRLAAGGPGVAYGGGGAGGNCEDSGAGADGGDGADGVVIIEEFY